MENKLSSGGNLESPSDREKQLSHVIDARKDSVQENIQLKKDIMDLSKQITKMRVQSAVLLAQLSTLHNPLMRHKLALAYQNKTSLEATVRKLALAAEDPPDTYINKSQVNSGLNSVTSLNHTETVIANSIEGRESSVSGNEENSDDTPENLTNGATYCKPSESIKAKEEVISYSSIVDAINCINTDEPPKLTSGTAMECTDVNLPEIDDKCKSQDSVVNISNNPDSFLSESRNNTAVIENPICSALENCCDEGNVNEIEIILDSNDSPLCESHKC